MISHFLSMEWKQFFRSRYWQKSIGFKIFLAFFALYFIIIFLGLGVAIYPILKKTYPTKDPFIIVNSFLFYWLMGDLMVRFFFQKLPVMSVKPLLTLNIKKSKVLNYVLGKSAVSFFNFLPLFAIFPFSAILISKGYDVSAIATWIITLMISVQIINYLNFIIESLSAKTDLSFLPLIAFSAAVYALNYFDIISFTSLISKSVLAIANNPILIIIPILILITLYLFNYKLLKEKLYLDSSLKTVVKEAKTSDLAWTNRFGDIAPFMQLDLKLIMRNKRSKSTLPILIIGLLYGLIFYPNPIYKEMVWMYAFVGIFVTGSFLINFGQFIPAWDSGYYKLLMSQNFKYKNYLKSKFTLMAMSVIILFALSIPYVYFGWRILLVHFAAMIYNIGVNTHVIMFGGSFNRKKINLDQRAAFNYQGTGAVQWLIGIPLMVIPMGIFALTNKFFSFEIAVLVLTVLGLLGIVFHQRLMKAITNKYIASKYIMINAFGQEN